jgi:hypothetical protein
MAYEPKHLRSIPGDPRPSDIFKPHRLNVELFEDMDEFFQHAREIASGEKDDEETRAWKKFEGQRSVAIVTPGRLIMLDPCPEPNSMPEEKVAPMRQLMPPDPPLKITAICYTFVEALTTDIDKAIPFRGFLNAWSYLGHSVLVFEGHPSAFERGVRDCDIILADSAMVQFVPLNWLDVARRVMKPNGKILIHNRPSYSLIEVLKPKAASPNEIAEERYVEFLLRLLMQASRSSIEITSGSTVPDVTELMTNPTDREWLSKTLSFSFEREKLSADSVIDRLLKSGGWSWASPFKKTGTLKLPLTMSDGSTRDIRFGLTLKKDSAGRRQLEIDR